MQTQVYPFADNRSGAEQRDIQWSVESVCYTLLLVNGISPSWSNRMSVEIVSFLSVLIEIVLDAHNCDVSCFPLFSRRMRMADRMSGLSGTVISSLFEGRKDERYFQSVPASISRLRSFSKYSSVLLHSFSCCL